MQRICLWLLMLVWLLPGQKVAAMPTVRPVELTPETAVSFVTDYMTASMEAMHVPGAAIVIVQGEEIVLAQGFGYANLAQQQPVTVDQTLFRAGSVSKLFTATAVMQLVERGQLDLNTDVNHYLTRLQIPDNGGPPVTVADLLRHTAGFDEQFIGMHVRQASEVQPLATFLQHHLPPRTIPAGTLISYNDHGYTLAGLLVEEVTGQSFADYMAANVLQPLQMNHSSFHQPNPAATVLETAVGYRFNGETYQTYPMDYVNVGPAAGLTALPAEMAHFMLAHLNGGRHGEAQILQPETVAQMQQTQVAHHPALRGRGYGFAEWQENGQRAIFHDGGNPGFLNRLFLLPQARVGFYLTFNGDQYSSAVRFHREFTTQFLDAFFPETAVSSPPPGDTMPLQRPTSDFSGYYREVTPYSHDTLEKIASLPNQFAVRAAGDTLTFFGRTYGQTEPLLFQSSDGESTVAFGENTAGKLTYLFAGTSAMVKVPWYEAQPVQLGLAIWFLLLFLTAVGIALGWQTAPTPWRLTLGLTGLLNFIFLIGLTATLLRLDPWQFVFAPPATFLGLLVLPLITTVLAILLLPLTVAAAKSGQWSFIAQLASALLVLTALGFPLFLNFWNLLGFHY